MTKLFQIIDGKVHSGTFGQAQPAPGKPSLTWVHLDLAEADDTAWLAARDDIPDTARGALLSRETRPRTEFMDGGAIINLRGLGLTPDDDPDPLSSLRFWAEDGHVVSASFRNSASQGPVESAFGTGRITTAGGIIAEFARDMANRLDPQVAALGDHVDFCESRLEGRRVHVIRRKVASSRSQAIAFRRFVVPQIHALDALSDANPSWVNDDDRLKLREALDRSARMAEELESVRERSALIADELTDLRAEQMNQRGLLVSIVALVFLPITFVTGLFGMNVEGIPINSHPQAFWIIAGFCVGVSLALIAWFIRAHWLRDRG